MRPLIGVTISEYPEYRGYRVREDYLRWVEVSGGIAILLYPTSPLLAPEYAALLDGIIFTGGGDVAPEFFGELPEPVPFDPEPQRDHFELALVKAAWEQKVPMLGICRGMQAINIALGGSIYQDLEYAGINRINHRQTQDMKETSHPVRICDAALEQLLGCTVYDVNSGHHQAVKRLADGLIPAAVAPDDVLEAYLCDDGEHYILGIQWHPEAMVTDGGIFRTFIHKAYAKKTYQQPQQEENTEQ